MALTDQEQALQLIKGANRVLISFPPNQGGDAVGTALALMLTLESIGKRADIVTPGFELPGSLRFLPQAKRIQTQVAPLRKFIISVDLKRTPLQDLSYSTENDELTIYLTPKSGSYVAPEVRTRSSDFNYDLILTVATPDLDSLGNLFHQNTEFFYQTTILNLDSTAANERFGQVNLVNPNAPSVAEVAFDFIEVLAPLAIDAEVATCLYAGLSVGTKSFTTPKVTPDTLARAAELVDRGARREEVVSHLYRTKTLSVLKLWGRVLARLKSDSARKLVWSLLTPDDFIKAGGSPTDLPGVVDELISGAPEAGTIVILYEVKAGLTSAYLHAGPAQHASDLLKPWNPSGDKHTARADLPLTLLEAEKVVLEQLKQVLPTIE